MKKFANAFIFGLVIIAMATSCGPNANDKKDSTIKNPNQLRTGGAVEVEEVITMKVKFGDQMISLDMNDIINISEKMSTEDKDAMDVMNLNQALMSAEKEEQLLDVNFSMSDEPIENGMFIFGIHTEDAKNLTLEIHDEEGFTLVANNIFEINEGQNYKALNVSSLEQGKYNFRIKDDAGRELDREFSIVE